MHERSIVSAIIILLFAVGLKGEDNRIYFAYRAGDGSGYFKNTGEGKWIEKLADGGTCTFKETAREKEYIEIYDSTRGGVWVRMYATESQWKHPEQTSGEWRPLWPGSWMLKARCDEEYGLGRDSIMVNTGTLRFDVTNYPPFCDKNGNQIRGAQYQNAVIRFGKQFFYRYTEDGRYIAEVRLAE